MSNLSDGEFGLVTASGPNQSLVASVRLAQRMVWPKSSTFNRALAFSRFEKQHGQTDDHQAYRKR